MAQTILGVDLGTYSLKVAVIERSFGDFQLKGFYEVPLIAEEVLSPEEAASAAFHKFLQDYPVTYDLAVAGVSGDQVSVRNLDLPFNSPKKIAAALAFELESMIPLDIEDILFDYSILDKQAESSQILCAYLREEDFARKIQNALKGDLDPRYWGVDLLSLSYLPSLGTLPPEGSYAILDLGHQKTNFAVFEEGKLKMAKSFSWGGHQLNHLIEELLQVDEAAARDYKHHKASLRKNSSKPVLQALYKSFEDLSLKIKQSLFAFKEKGGTAMEALYLCGGTSQISGVDAFFSEKLSINVSFLETLDAEVPGVSSVDQARRLMPNALGLALQGIFPQKGSFINFRQGDYAYKRDFQELGGSFKRLAVMAASVALLGIAYYSLSYWSLSDQVEKANKNVAKLVTGSVSDFPPKKLRSAKAMISVLNGRIQKGQEELAVFDAGASLSSLKVLQLISKAMPPREVLKLDVDNLSLSLNQGRLEGSTSSFESVAKIKSALETVEFFKNVQKIKEVKGVRGEIKFSLSFDIIVDAIETKES